MTKQKNISLYYRLLQLNKVLGIDIGANFVVAFYLDELPTPPYKDWYRKHGKGRIHKLLFDNSGDGKIQSGVRLNAAIALIQTLAPDIIVMEPTGVWYSRIWAEIAAQLSIEVRWIGHQDLHFMRGSYGFNDKDDRTDAFCLAVTGCDPTFDPTRWINWRCELAGDIHRTLLEIKGLEATSVPITNQLRQRLKYEFPEISKRTINNVRTTEGFTAWVGWLAGIHTYKRIENDRERSIATQLSIEISSYTQSRAKTLAEHQIKEIQLHHQLEKLLAHPDLEKYLTVLDRIGFGNILKAAIISNIYPFDKFLTDGKKVIERWEDDRGFHKRDRSRAAFQISIGMGKRLIESGGTTKWRYAGSGLARTLLHQWTVTHVLCKHDTAAWIVTELDRKAALPAQINNKQKRPKPVSEHYYDWKGTKGSNADRHKACIRASMTLAYRVTRILYDELIEEFT
jgi:hypothetical protein